MPQKKSDVQLNRIVGDALYLFEGRCAKSGIRVEQYLDTHLPDIQADQVQLNQVLINLLSNAIAAMPSGGDLWIKTKSKLDDVILTIQDSGIGMNEETVGQIFEPFFSTKEKDEGTGLGLSVVQDIVKAHGGTITVKSEIGKGTLFAVRLPTKDPE
jgi:signal transduction histidine kinase